MRFGYDAKRAFHNTTGLGHYSRTLLQSLSRYHPDHDYYLFNPKKADLFRLEAGNLHEVRPQHWNAKLFPSAWRSKWVKKDLKEFRIDLYHGLSHEIPIGIKDTGISSVVTMHDLIHERYPDQYNPVDVRIYRKKFRYAAEHSDHIIAISEQTKNDLETFYQVPSGRITVCYQSCNPAFGQTIPESEKIRVRKKYGIPDEFFLTVGSIIERKNLLNICKAVFLLRDELPLPLVVIGSGGRYKQKVVDFIRQNKLEKKIIFLSDDPRAKESVSFRSAEDFPAIYQSAIAMIYPSFFEGFGIPVLEALWSRLPVITSNVSCLPEAGGDGAYYINPNNAEEIAMAMKKIYSDKNFASEMRGRGWIHAQRFTPQKCAAAVMDVYLKTLQSK